MILNAEVWCLSTAIFLKISGLNLTASLKFSLKQSQWLLVQECLGICRVDLGSGFDDKVISVGIGLS